MGEVLIYIILRLTLTCFVARWDLGVYEWNKRWKNEITDEEWKSWVWRDWWIRREDESEMSEVRWREEFFSGVFWKRKDLRLLFRGGDQAVHSKTLELDRRMSFKK